MTSVLSLIANHLNSRSQVQALKIVENEIPACFRSQSHIHTQVHRTKGAYIYTGVLNKKCVLKYTHFHAEKSTHVGNLMVGPWYLV